MKRAILLVVVGLLTAPNLAFAHIFLDHSAPAADALIERAPEQLVLDFDGPVEGVDFDIALRDAAGLKLASQASKGVIVHWATVTIPLPPLKKGHYLVQWHVRLKPGHETEGSYGFTVSE